MGSAQLIRLIAIRLIIMVGNFTGRMVLIPFLVIVG